MNKSPNLLFMMYDQQRYDCLSPAGRYPVKTPNLEALASSGVWFERAYTPVPVCTPARQCLFTGRRSEGFGGLWNPHIVFPVCTVPEDEPLWTRSIKANGYSTAYVGLWETDSRRSPLDYGFDSWVSRADINAEISAAHPGISYKNGFFGEENPVPLEDSYTHLTAKHAIEALDRLHAEGKPWYLHIDSPEPHLPCRPSKPFSEMYDPDSVPVWESFSETFEGKPYIQRQQLINWRLEDRGWDEWKHTAALYYGIISQYDDAVGRILRHLEQLGELENTIIVYTADHGDFCGDHRLIDKHYAMYENLCHIPMIIRWDGHIAPGRFKGFSHNGLDLPPTLLSLMGIERPDGACFQGADLSDALRKGDMDAGGEFAVSCYNGQQFGLYCERAITDGDYRYVWNLTDIDELYDLHSDPGELKNLIGSDEMTSERTEKLHELRKKLYDELSRVKDPIIGWTGAQLTENRKL